MCVVARISHYIFLPTFSTHTNMIYSRLDPSSITDPITIESQIYNRYSVYVTHKRWVRNTQYP